MVKTNSKVVRLTSDTLDLIENYRSIIIYNTNNENLRKFIEEMSIDKIINSALSDAYLRCTKSKV